MPPLLLALLGKLYHYLAYVAGGAVIVVCIVALIFKFWVMPHISHYEGALKEAASRAIGHPVDITALEADWSGFNPRVILHGVSMTPPAGPPLKILHVEAVFSWLSLPLLELRLASLSLDKANVSVRRDAAGVITLAGIPVNLPGPPNPLPNWLLGQPRIVIKGAEIVWQDALRHAPELRFSGVRLLLENRFGRHRFGGIAYPSAAAARRFEVRGDLNGRSVQDWPSWSGEIYARVDDARFESWGRWVPWAHESVRSGLGDIRFWLKVGNGKALSLHGDARLEKVALNIDPQLPDLLFDRLTGRAGWEHQRDVHTFFVDHLRFKTPQAEPSEPASLRVDLTSDASPKSPGGFKRIDVKAHHLQLEALTALTGALPLPTRVNELIKLLNPRGLVEESVGHWISANDYAFKLRIRAGGIHSYAQFPGINGLTAHVAATQAGGEAVIDGRSMTLTLPNIFWQDLNFSQLDAKADWKFDPNGMKLNFAAERIVNPDLDGSLEGSLFFPKTGPIQSDIHANLSRGEATAVYRYLPKVVGDATYQWVKQGLLAGNSDKVSLVLKGPLDRFPFDRGGGEFKVAVKINEAALHYAPGWPRIEAANGHLLFQGSAMNLAADSGRILATRLGPVQVSIPNLHEPRGPVLRVDGQAYGETSAFFDFIKRSPVNGYTNHFTEPFKAQGEGRLNLHLQLPLHNMGATSVAGSFSVTDNQLAPGGEFPELSQINGRIDFTQASLQAKGVRARVLDLPVILAIDNVVEPGSTEHHLRIHLDGEMSASALKPYVPASLLGRISGETRWQADLGMKPGASEGDQRKPGLTIQSDLVGLAIDLPTPFSKTAAQSMPLSVIKEPTETEAWFVRLGEIFTLRARMGSTGPARLNLRFGRGEASVPTEAGLSVSGTTRLLDLDAWRQINFGSLSEGKTSGEGKTLALREASLTFNEIRLFNRRLNDTHVKLQPVGAGWRLSLAGRELTGDLTTLPSAEGVFVKAQFKRLSWPEAAPKSVPGAQLDSPKPTGNTASKLEKRLLGVEVSAENVVWQGHELGELRLRMSSNAKGLVLDNFSLVNPDGRLSGKGVIAQHPLRPTQLEFELESDTLDKLLDRVGLPDSVKRGTAHITGPLSWMGGIEKFDLAKVEGDLTVSMKKGQFLKVDPGAGKLLGILSLQALPRRIALDFRDVFSEGFAFDEIAGQVHLERGSAYTKNLRMNGPAAKVRMSGVADLVHESQNLRVHIQPRLEDTLAVAGALLGGPVIGVGALIASKVLQNPLGQAASFEYVITGPWAEPVITKLAKPKLETVVE